MISSKGKKGLGRGLTALFGDQKTKVDQKGPQNINKIQANISDLSPNKYQPRTHFNEEKLEELASSIKRNGIIQPIAVREIKEDAANHLLSPAII